MADTSEPQKSELSGWERRHEADGGKPTWEMDGAQRMELDGTQPRGENKPTELMGTIPKPIQHADNEEFGP